MRKNLLWLAPPPIAGLQSEHFPANATLCSCPPSESWFRHCSILPGVALSGSGGCILDNCTWTVHYIHTFVIFFRLFFLQNRKWMMFVVHYMFSGGEDNRCSHSSPAQTSEQAPITHTADSSDQSGSVAQEESCCFAHRAANGGSF